MSLIKIPVKFIRISIGILLLFVALNAFGGGYYGMTGAKNVPLEWLKGSPFHNYFLPGLILFVCVGGSALFAAMVVFKQKEIALRAVSISLIILIIWLAVQVTIIGYVSWLQPATGIGVLVILLLTMLLPNDGY